MLALHRIRERLIRDRTSLTNQAHGLLGEFGIILPRGPRLSRELVSVLDTQRVPKVLEIALRDELEHLRKLNECVQSVTRQLGEWRAQAKLVSA